MSRYLKRQPIPEDDSSYVSDTEESRAYWDILDKAEITDFENEVSLRKFEADFRENETLHETLLHRLAQLKSREFYEKKGPALIQWILRNHPDLLTKGVGYPKPKFPLHIAIDASNHYFLDCFLDVSDDTSINIAEAFEIVNNEQYNCLHSAIAKKLPCAARMVTKCSEHALKMVDGDKNTPLHLAMGLSTRTWAPKQQMAKINKERTPSNVSKARTAGDHHDPMVKPKSSTGPDKPDARTRLHESKLFDPADVLEEMKKIPPKDSMNTFMAKLLTATNKDGRSPYQVRLHVFKNPAAEEIKFQEDLKNLIFDCLTEIPDTRKALYGTEGYFQSSPYA